MIQIKRYTEALRRVMREEGLRGMPGLAHRFWVAHIVCRGVLKAEKARRAEADARYQAWLKRQTSDEAERRAQRETRFAHRLSFLIPTYNTRPELLEALADSLLNQTCEAWEACFYDGCSTAPETRDALSRLAARDRRFRVEMGQKNLNISGNTNLAAEMAEGDWFALCDHDDLLASDAVYHVLTAAENGADFVYSDEDKCSEDGARFFDPHLKPDFSPEALRSGNYVCHLMAMEATLFRRVGGLRSRFDGSQDHDLALRATEQAKKITHIPRVLYHWRMVGSSVSHQGAARCAEAAAAAVQSQLDRLHIDGTVVLRQLRPHLCYAVPEDASIALLVWAEERGTARWLRALRRRTAEKISEVILIDGGNQPVPGARRAASAAEAAQTAQSTYVAFVAQGLLPENPHWLREMLMFAQRENVGMTGGPVVDRLRRYLNAGYAVDVPGGAVSHHAGACCLGHTCQLTDRTAREVTATSAALCMMRRETYLRFGCFDGFASDLKGAAQGALLQREGYVNLYTPFALMRAHGCSPCLTGDAPEADKRRMAALVGEHPAERYYSPLFEKRLGAMRVDDADGA